MGLSKPALIMKCICKWKDEQGKKGKKRREEAEARWAWVGEGREVEAGSWVGGRKRKRASERGNELTIAPHEMLVVYQSLSVCVCLCVCLLFRSVSFSFVEFGSVSFIYSRHLLGVVVPTVRLTNRLINLWFHKRNLNCISRAGRAKQSSDCDCERCFKQKEAAEAEKGR